MLEYIDYKEVFTSDKGYGGLQDDLAYIVGEFGYIFYNDDFHKLYQFDDGQLKIMDEDIKTTEAIEEAAPVVEPVQQ